MNSECIEDIVEDDLDNSFDFYKWHHLCFVYGHVMKDGLHIVDLELYLDGLKVNSARYSLTNFLPVLRKGIVILGQEQDSFGGFFDENQAFSGELSQVEIWSLKLQPATIKAIGI